MAENKGPYVTTRDIVEETSVAPVTVSRWVADGKITPIHKGKGIRGGFLFDRNAVEAFLEERKRRQSKD
jgi:predicted site-specific integrase-resolvase